MFKTILFFAFISNCLAQQKLEWSYCGQSIFTIQSFDLGNMPIEIPSEIPLLLDLTLNRDIKGPLITDLSIVRSVSGLSLAFKCFSTSIMNIGSCIYSNFCEFIKFMNDFFIRHEFEQDKCPEELVNNGFNCTCPSNLSKGNYRFDTKLYSNEGSSTDSTVTLLNYMR